jgi:hypothetical protein
MNTPPNRSKRIALMISGATDALIGAVLLLIGFRILPFEVTMYGIETWIVNLLGALMFLLGAGVFAYNISRLEE